MTLLIIGLLLFTLTHLFLGLAPEAAGALRQRIGDGPVKGLIALANLSGIVLMVLGWRSGYGELVYVPPTALRTPAIVLIAFAFYLFVVSSRPAAVKRVIRHPQLTAVALWALGHLLTNGDSFSLVTFATLGVWAVLEMLLINRRDGSWIKAPAPGLATEIVTLAVAIVVIAALAWAHPWLAGVPILGMR